MAGTTTAFSTDRTYLVLIIQNVCRTLGCYPISLTLTVILVRFLYRKYASPLRKYPGPYLAGGSRLWQILSAISGTSELDYIALHKKHGPIVRVAPNKVSLSSPSAAIYISAPSRGFNKTDFYDAYPTPERHLFNERRPDLHVQQARAITSCFSMSAMQKLTPWMDKIQSSFMEKLDNFAGKGNPFDFPKFLHFFSFDIIGEIAFGKSFGFLEAEKDIGNSIAVIDRSQFYNAVIGFVPWLDIFLRRNPLWEFIPLISSKETVISKIALQAIQERQEGIKSDRKDLVSSMLEVSAKDPSTFPISKVYSNTFGVIFAGSDSTTATMLRFLYHVHLDPRVNALLIAEIDKAQVESKLSEMITWREAQDLPYFQACLKESMRYGPASGLPLPREVPSEGAVINGEYLPPHTEVCLNSWVLHRDHETFGPDTDNFRPERWLEASEEQLKMMERSMYQFGGGSRICTGRHFALLEMNKLLPQLLRRYKITLLKPGRLTHNSTGFFIIRWDMPIKLELRQQVQHQGTVE